MWLLLDAHIVIWTLVDDGRLPGEARLLIEGEGNEILRNVASSWGGVDIKHATHLDRILTGGSEFMGYCETSGFSQLLIFDRHVRPLETIERTVRVALRNDSFDRFMLAQAKAGGLVLLMHDARIAKWGESCVLRI